MLPKDADCVARLLEVRREVVVVIKATAHAVFLDVDEHALRASVWGSGAHVVEVATRQELAA
jgi:hypothetical protein